MNTEHDVTTKQQKMKLMIFLSLRMNNVLQIYELR